MQTIRKTDPGRMKPLPATDSLPKPCNFKMMNDSLPT